MRPAGEVREALRMAARLQAEALPEGRGATLRELASRACVGAAAALHTVKHMTRSGELVIVGRRRVEYRNRPVAEYRPAKQDFGDGCEVVDLADVFSVWNG